MSLVMFLHDLGYHFHIRSVMSVTRMEKESKRWSLTIIKMGGSG